MSTLKFLDITKTYVSKLPPALGESNSLEFLKILGSKINELPEFILEIDTLKEVGISEEQYKKMRKKSKNAFNKLLEKCDVLVLTR